MDVSSRHAQAVIHRKGTAVAGWAPESIRPIWREKILLILVGQEPRIVQPVA